MDQMKSRKQPGVAFWGTVMVVALLVAYPLSAGPAEFWLAPKLRSVPGMTTTIYTVFTPYRWAFAHSPDCIRDTIAPYDNWWALGVDLPPR
jgi:hypothetical protein